MLLKETKQGDIVLVGKNRVYAIGDQAYKVGLTRESSIENSKELLPVTYINDNWVRTQSGAFRRDMDTEITRLAECQ